MGPIRNIIFLLLLLLLVNLITGLNAQTTTLRQGSIETKASSNEDLNVSGTTIGTNITIENVAIHSNLLAVNENTSNTTSDKTVSSEISSTSTTAETTETTFDLTSMTNGKTTESNITATESATTTTTESNETTIRETATTETTTTESSNETSTTTTETSAETTITSSNETSTTTETSAETTITSSNETSTTTETSTETTITSSNETSTTTETTTTTTIETSTTTGTETTTNSPTTLPPVPDDMPQNIIRDNDGKPCILANLKIDIVPIYHVHTDNGAKLVTVPIPTRDTTRSKVQGACKYQNITVGDVIYPGPVIIYSWNWPNKTKHEQPTTGFDNRVEVGWIQDIADYYIDRLSFNVKPNDESIFPDAVDPDESITMKLDDLKLFTSVIGKSYKCKIGETASDKVQFLIIRGQVEVGIQTDKFSAALECKNDDDDYNDDEDKPSPGLLTGVSIVIGLATFGLAAFFIWYLRRKIYSNRYQRII